MELTFFYAQVNCGETYTLYPFRIKIYKYTGGNKNEYCFLLH